jgi:TPR repeat protein
MIVDWHITQMRWLFIAALYLIASTMAVAGAPLEEAIAARDRGDYSAALRLFLPLAEQGNAEAQNNIGVLYIRGQGVQKNGLEAMKWFRLAANTGMAKAQYNLGRMYAFGIGVPPNVREAAAWYRRAADQGYAEAQFNLGALYYAGSLADSKHPGAAFNEAADWYRRAAEQGFVQAQERLAGLYNNGLGVARDPMLAYAWAQLAAAQGSQQGDMIARSVRQGLTQLQITEADKLAREFKAKSMTSVPRR